MPNTTVTITYANGSTREFVASDDLEQLINEGEMFSVTTLHSDMSIDEEVALSKMYAGNPIAAMGNMIIMRSNAEKILKENDSDDHIPIVIDTLTACIKLLSDEVTSHQSGMSPVEYKPEGRQFRKGEPLIPVITHILNDNDLKLVDAPESFFCGNSDENDICTHSCHLDNPCIKDENCEGFIPF